ncbi:hypothetical protein MAR_032456 [Mya arenaria]|uniref:C1q domain-containing protein n=1 Tax=Mya arenaria TaxID=6604 RepID=A0ABY7FA19_MYAAR|nr:putative leucine-rich repeat-containing protein DDB_G0290503 [Mya arenaria]WAR17862.1 hypothetical protein MAR_032456 [Mya arenaria]
MAYSCTIKMNLGLILLFMVVSISRIDADEMLTKIMFKVMANEDKFESMEAQFTKSLEELESRLNGKIDKVIETLNKYEPNMGDIANDIKRTISNSVTGLVKSQYVSITKSIKQEKKVLMQIKNDIDANSKQMQSEIVNAQMRLDERFENQTALIEHEFNSAKHELEGMKNVIQNDSDNLSVLFEDLKSNLIHQTKTEKLEFEEHFLNQTKELETRYSLKESDIDIQMALFQNESLDNSLIFENKFKDALEDLAAKDVYLESRLSNHDSAISSVRSSVSGHSYRLSSIDGKLSSYKSSLDTLSSNIRSYKTSADSVGYRISGIETKLSKHSSFYAVKQKREDDMRDGLRLRHRGVFRNEGSDYSSVTGYYTAPEDGVYSFWLSVEARYGKRAVLCLYHDDMKTGIQSFEENGGGAGQVGFIYLTRGSKVSVHSCFSGSSIDPVRTAFSGVLLYTK